MTSPRSNRYPDDSVQDILDFSHTGAKGWWEPQPDGYKLERGALLWTFVPHPNLPPQELVPERGRDLESAEMTLTRMTASPRRLEPDPPVAALPHPDRLQVRRGAVRPVVVLSHLHGYPPQPSEARRWMTTPLALVAPYYGADPWPEALVASIRSGQHPHYVWDRLPIEGPAASILRLDQSFPLHRQHTDLFRMTGFRLASDALAVLEDWQQWLLTGKLPADGDLYAAHTTLRELLEG